MDTVLQNELRRKRDHRNKLKIELIRWIQLWFRAKSGFIPKEVFENDTFRVFNSIREHCKEAELEFYGGTSDMDKMSIEEKQSTLILFFNVLKFENE